MKTTYDSIPIMTHIVGSKSRKAMYLVMPTSMDGNKIYKNAWIPTRWTSRADNVQHTIAWEHITDEYVELSMREVTPAMLIETLSTYRKLLPSTESKCEQSFLPKKVLLSLAPIQQATS